MDAPDPRPGARTPTSHDLLRLCLTLSRASWRSLAIVPADPELPSREAADTLAETTAAHALGTYRVVDGRGASLEEAGRVAAQVAAATRSGERVLVAVDSPAEHAGAMPLVAAADAALIVVRIRTSKLQSTRDVIELIGRDRVIGCATV